MSPRRIVVAIIAAIIGTFLQSAPAEPADTQPAVSANDLATFGIPSQGIPDTGCVSQAVQVITTGAYTAAAADCLGAEDSSTVDLLISVHDTGVSVLLQRAWAPNDEQLGRAAAVHAGLITAVQAATEDFGYAQA